MSDIYPPKVQREALLKFAEALCSRDNALRRDENGDWRISGKFGHIYGVPEGFQIMVVGEFSQRPMVGRGKTRPRLRQSDAGRR